MAIINLPADQVLSLAQKKKQKVERIKFKNTQLLNQIIETVKANMAEVWQDADQENFSPQQVFDLLGSDAAAMVGASLALCNLVNSIVPNTLPASAPKVLTPNQDGTITVGA